MTKGKYIRTPEIRRKISDSLMGRTQPKEICDNLSKLAKQRHIDGTFGMKGLSHSIETKEKMRLAHLGRKYNPISLIGRQNMSKAQTGKKLSMETREKMSIARSGKNNHNWKGGISIDSHSTSEPKYKKWREAVFSRDSYTCQECGKNKCYIESHHIKSWAKYPELRYIISNGKTLCSKCHKLTPSYGGKKN